MAAAKAELQALLARVREGSFDAVLVITCKLIKKARFIPTTKEATAEEAARLYYEHIYREHGFPLRLVSDT